MKSSLVMCGAVSTLWLALALSGCTSDERKNAAPPGPVTLTPEPEGDGATVFLRGHTAVLEPKRLVVDVVARGAHDLHGAAFRVTWDPGALAFVEAKSGETWSKQALAIAKEATPGQLAVVWTEKGETGIDATSETILGTLTFDAVGHEATSLAFKVERSELVDKKGIKVDATWRGGTVAAH